MSKIKIGDIFEFEMQKGKAYLHFIYKDKSIGELIRVFKCSEEPSDLENLIKNKELFMIYFPLSAAYKQSIIKKVSHYSAINYPKPLYMRGKHVIKGEFKGWHIINTDTWQRELVQELSPEHKQLSPWGIWNDTLLRQRLEKGWTLENW